MDSAKQKSAGTVGYSWLDSAAEDDSEGAAFLCRLTLKKSHGDALGSSV